MGFKNNHVSCATFCLLEIQLNICHSIDFQHGFLHYAKLDQFYVMKKKQRGSVIIVKKPNRMRVNVLHLKHINTHKSINHQVLKV